MNPPVSFLAKIQAAYEMAVGMAFGRSAWIDKVRTQLEGALGEYAKQRYADLAGYSGHNWGPEVDRLLQKVATYLDPKRVKAKGFWDRKRAFAEAYAEACLSQHQITEARNKIEDKLSPEQREIFLKNVKLTFVEFDSENLMREMLISYSELANLINK